VIGRSRLDGGWLFAVAQAATKGRRCKLRITSELGDFWRAGEVREGERGDE
jgi:hypothetical protein